MTTSATEGRSRTPRLRADQPATERELQAREAWRRLIGGLLPHPRADVLSVPSGSGELAQLAAEAGGAVVAVDDNDRTRQLARRRRRGAAPRFIVADATCPPLAPRSFDLVLCRLAELPGECAFGSWMTLLRPGGKLVVLTGVSESDPAASGSSPRRRRPRPEGHVFGDRGFVRFRLPGDVPALLPASRWHGR